MKTHKVKVFFNVRLSIIMAKRNAYSTSKKYQAFDYG